MNQSCRGEYTTEKDTKACRVTKHSVLTEILVIVLIIKRSVTVNLIGKQGSIYLKW
jgi:hypothetical protein